MGWDICSVHLHDFICNVYGNTDCKRLRSYGIDNGTSKSDGKIDDYRKLSSSK
jgi:hypothetical protein